MIEIERKFLVTSKTFKEEAISKIKIVQGFLNTNPERTVRIRIMGEKAFLTVKGIGNTTGISRFEWEKEISVAEAEQLLLLAEPGIIAKVRYHVNKGKHVFEVDEFLAANQGLVVAEIELSSENESFDKPDWLGEEVSGITKYYNSQLSKNPYIYWND